MQKIMIVDDEPIILEGISKMIDWESLGASLCGTYSNGVDALTAITEDPPDVVIADIRMPGMSGLDLIRNCAELHLDTQFIILSGYSEFEYAQQSMKYGVRHYLLKPCSKDDIAQAAKEALSDARKAKESHPVDNEVFQLNNVARQGVMASIINEAMFRDQPIENLTSQYEAYFDFSHNAFRLFYIYYLPQEKLESFLAALKEEYTKRMPQITLYSLYVRNTYMLMYSDPKMESGYVTDFLKRVKGDFGSATLEWEDTLIPNGKELIEVLISKIRRYGSFYYINNFKPFLEINYTGLMPQIEALYNQAKNGTPEDEKNLIAVFDSISDPVLCRQIAVSFLLKTANDSSESYEMVEWLKTIENEENIDALHSKISAQISKVLQQHRKSSSSESSLTERICDYVSRNLDNPLLTLKYICEQYLYMNVDYVSRKFHQEMGQKFSAYLTDLRISRAQKIIENNPNALISDVAEKIGFGNNPQYFSQLFRKKTGITPSMYAEQIKEKKQKS
ncbi:MAG: response regulator transcription factor [Lachnospiraceae bacterium]|jgi:two-component system response regulator YesN